MNICKVSLLILVIMAVFQAVAVYNYFKEHPQKEFEWKTYEQPPEELIIKSNMINKLRNTLIFGLFIMVIWQYGLYLDQPNKFWLMPVITFFEKMEDEKK